MMTVHMPVKKTSWTLRSVEDDLGLKVSGTYSIPCECGKTGQSIETMCKNIPDIYVYYQPVKSVVAEHSTESGHQIKY
jgi:hypothetical protein